MFKLFIFSVFQLIISKHFSSALTISEKKLLFLPVKTSILNDIAILDQSVVGDIDGPSRQPLY